MNLTLTIVSKKIFRILAIIALLLAVISIGGKHIEAYAGTESPHVISQLVRLFNINRASSIPTWYASSILFACAVLLAVNYRATANP